LSKPSRCACCLPVSTPTPFPPKGVQECGTAQSLPPSFLDDGKGPLYERPKEVRDRPYRVTAPCQLLMSGMHSLFCCLTEGTDNLQAQPWGNPRWWHSSHFTRNDPGVPLKWALSSYRDPHELCAQDKQSPRFSLGSAEKCPKPPVSYWWYRTARGSCDENER
jgi:hypothetical protein